MNINDMAPFYSFEKHHLACTCVTLHTKLTTTYFKLWHWKLAMKKIANFPYNTSNRKHANKYKKSLSTINEIDITVLSFLKIPYIDVAIQSRCAYGDIIDVKKIVRVMVLTHTFLHIVAWMSSQLPRHPCMDLNETLIGIDVVPQV